MNKLIKVLCFVLVFILTGCGKEKYMTCKIELKNDDQQYNLSATYKVYHDGTYVTRIEKKEVYKSDNEDTLEYFDEYKRLEYKNLNSLYSGYIYKVDKNANSVTLEADIDLEEVDISEMLLNNYLDRDYVLSNRLTVTGASYLYSSKGAECDI